jgi:hypothetical protein
MNKTNVRHWQSTHNDWLRALDFYKGEIAILDERLQEIAAKNTSHEVSAQVEHFQNAFILHRSNIEELQHAINLNLKKIAEEAETQNGFISGELVAQLEKEMQGFKDEEKEINELRHAFNLFASEWM